MAAGQFSFYKAIFKSTLTGPLALHCDAPAPALSRAVAACFLAVGFCAPAWAVDLTSVDRAVGVWELQMDSGAQKCSMQLRNDPMGGGYALTLPQGCRLMMPGVATIAVWTLPSSGRLDMSDRAGKTVLSFVPIKDGPFSGRLKATGVKGETYTLISASDAAIQQRTAGQTPASQAVSPSAPPAAGAPQRSPIRISAAEMAGRYAVLRDGSRETGCMLTLDVVGQRAQLAPACRDNGFVVFDPKSWTVSSGGRLEMTARKGHRAGFEHMSDGSWQKDPKEGGKPLGFRKM